MSIAANMKGLRKQRRLTQAGLAEAIGIKRSLVGAYEEGRAEPKLTTLVTIARFFGLNVDQFISDDFSAGLPETGLIPPTVSAPAAAPAPLRSAAGPRVLAITVDSRDGEENIELVPQRAAAGYLNGYADPEFVAELPRFRLPLAATRPGSGTYRAFEISGDSMLPLASGTVVVGRYLADPARDVRNGQPCIVVSPLEGVVFKRVYRKTSALLELRSDNPAYAPYEVAAADISELWEARAYVSTAFPAAPGAAAGQQASEEEPLSTAELTKLLRELQRQMANGN